MSATIHREMLSGVYGVCHLNDDRQIEHLIMAPGHYGRDYLSVARMIWSSRRGFTHREFPRNMNANCSVILSYKLSNALFCFLVSGNSSVKNNHDHNQNLRRFGSSKFLLFL